MGQSGKEMPDLASTLDLSPLAGLAQLSPGRQNFIVNIGAPTMRMLVHWIITALAVWITSRVVAGFLVSGAGAALIAAIVIGFINATLGLVLKVLTLPLTILTLGVFWFVINAFMLKLASAFVPGFRIQGFMAAFWGGIVLSLVNMLLKWLVLPARGT